MPSFTEIPSGRKVFLLLISLTITLASCSMRQVHIDGSWPDEVMRL